MPNLGVALTQFGHLIGVLDELGSVEWLWLTDPLGNTSKQMSAQRDVMAKLFAALQEPDGTDVDAVTPKDFDTSHWRPLSIGPVQVGVVWNKEVTDPLHLGLGAMYPRADGAKGVSASLLVRLLQVAPSLSSELGRLLLSADLTLDNDTLHEIKLQAGFDPGLAVALELTDHSDTKKAIKLPPTSNAAWDAARLAAFVTESWVAVKAQADTQAAVKDSFFLRMDKHFFPMLGDNATAIKPMTPMDATAQAGQFKAWTDSVLTTSSADGALLFLWHLRALITGNESGTVFGGSTWLPLLAPSAPNGLTGQPPTFVSSATTYAQTAAAGGTGVWLGIQEIANGTELAMDFRPGGGGAVESIALAQRVNGNLVRPNAVLNNANNLKTAVNLPAPAGSGLKIFGPDPDGSVRVEVLSWPGANKDIFDGAYAFSLLIKNGQPIRYRVDTPMLSMVLPPELPNPETLALQEAVWALTLLKTNVAAASPAAAAILTAFNALMAKYQGMLAVPGPASLQPKDALQLIPALLGAAGKLPIGDALSLAFVDSQLTASLQLGPFQPGDLAGLNIGLSELAATATFDLSKAAPLVGASLGLKGIQLPKANASSGLVSTLLPDTKSLPGFALTVGFTSTGFTVAGGGNIKVQQKIGPVDVSGLSVAITKQSLTIGIDLALSLGPIHVAAYDLGGTLTWSPPSSQGFGLNLRGLALSFDGGGIRLSGMFLNNNGDYVGGAVVSIFDRFQLSAIGGYTQVDGTASLFIFAALVAPLGGPPWFFITGIAGGFGFNRPLPPSSLLGEHPFMKVMRGELSFDPNQPGTALKTISGQFSPPQKGKYWIAAGIQFTCFAVINGKVIVAVSFGKEFSFQLLGMLSYGIKNICYFEIDFSVTADANHFLLTGALSPNSYLLDPSIFSLQGGFAMGVWYSGAYAGDFLISIGGYHPLFNRPENYPDLARVGVKAVVSGFVHVDVQCFFACTPHVLMAGASISMYAKFAGISAGLDVYADVLIQWDPFFLLARLGVCVWFKFCGRHEVHVDLSIHTPKFGGKAEIDLWLVSFTVKFGDQQLPGSKKLTFPDLLTRHLNVPATASGALGAKISPFSTAAATGLFRVDVTDGRTSKASGSSEQEGLGAPITVNPEFRFRVRSHLPLDETADPAPGLTLPLDATGKGAIDIPGTTSLALCGWADSFTDLRVEITQSGSASGKSPAINRLYDMFPMAVFGRPMKGAQADQSAGEALAAINPKKPSLPLLEGFEFVYNAVENPPGLDVSVSGSATTAEYSKPEETMPLPLDWKPTHPQVHAVGSTGLLFTDAALKQTVKFVPAGKSSANRAADLMKQRTRLPWQVLVTVATVQRASVTVSPKALSVNTLAAGRGLVATPVPQSPARQPELMAVALRLAPTTTPAPVRRLRPPFVIGAAGLSRAVLSLDNRGVQSALANVSRALETVDLHPAIALDAARTVTTPDVAPFRAGQDRVPVGPTPIPTPLPRPIPH